MGPDAWLAHASLPLTYHPISSRHRLRSDYCAAEWAIFANNAACDFI